jgi:hypothetical protein
MEVSGASTSDSAATLSGAEHVHRVTVSGGNTVSGVDSGFSFNAVTNTLGGDVQDDDLAADRTVQGSLRQFIQNANAITGANAMRFVPGANPNVITGVLGGGDDWWRITVTTELPQITDALTVIDGRAYLSDGTTAETNSAVLATSAV